MASHNPLDSLHPDFQLLFLSLHLALRLKEKKYKWIFESRLIRCIKVFGSVCTERQLYDSYLLVKIKRHGRVYPEYQTNECWGQPAGKAQAGFLKPKGTAEAQQSGSGNWVISWTKHRKGWQLNEQGKARGNKKKANWTIKAYCSKEWRRNEEERKLNRLPNKVSHKIKAAARHSQTQTGR